MNTHTIIPPLMIAMLLLTATTVSGKFGIVHPWQLRAIVQFQGISIGAMLVVAMVQLGWISK